MTPQINVNLKPCNCPQAKRLSRLHDIDCASTPVLIACPIPRSVTFEVMLGECTRGCATRGPANPPGLHDQRCPARPIRVTCSIDGETWARSEVSGFMSAALESVSGEVMLSTVAHACRCRWGFIKSPVLGHSLEDCPKAIRNMRAQRDAVFAALAEKTRTEAADDAAHVALFKTLDASGAASSAMHTVRGGAAEVGLAAYIERIIEQVSALP